MKSPLVRGGVGEMWSDGLQGRLGLATVEDFDQGAEEEGDRVGLGRSLRGRSLKGVGL